MKNVFLEIKIELNSFLLENTLLESGKYKQSNNLLFSKGFRFPENHQAGISS